MKRERFYCKECKRFFDKVKILEERHGLDNPPYERIAVCEVCGSDNFVKHNALVEKIEVVEKILPVVMYLNRYCNALKDIYGLGFRVVDVEDSLEIIIEAMGEMFECFDYVDLKKMFNACSENDIKKILMRLKG